MNTEQIEIKDIEPRQALLNALMLDMIANTDCSWEAATAAVAFWEYHYINHTAPVYGVVELGDEKPNVVYEGSRSKRSLKVGAEVGEARVIHWFFTIQS